MTDELLSRAIAAHYRAYKGGDVAQPSENASSIEEVGGKTYVVLRNVSGILRVYRIRNDGVLKGLRRWPKDLEENR